MTRTPTARSPARPRKRRSATGWAGLLARWRESGLELDDFARRHRVPAPSASTCPSTASWPWSVTSSARTRGLRGLPLLKPAGDPREAPLARRDRALTAPPEVEARPEAAVAEAAGRSWNGVGRPRRIEQPQSVSRRKITMSRLRDREPISGRPAAGECRQSTRQRTDGSRLARYRRSPV
jgi:hypothetical protein